MPVTPNHILDSEPGIGQVIMGFQYRVLDQNLLVQGSVKPLGAPSISATTKGTVKRSLTGFKLSEEDHDSLDPFSNRIMPIMVLEDGTEWPMGVYVFTDDPKNVGTYASTYDMGLMDQDFILSKGIRNPYGVVPGGSIVTAVNDVLDGSNIFQRDVPADSAKVIGDPTNWPTGTPRSTILGVLCKLAGWLPPYFNNEGVCTIRAPSDPNYDEADHTYTTERMETGSIYENDNLLDAPNVYVVISTGPSKGEISASAEVSLGLAFSVQNRGFEIPKEYRTQGITSTQQAQEMADSLALAGTYGFKTVSFVGPSDPRHDLFDTIEYKGDIYTETDWSLVLKSGAKMSHNMTLGGFNFSE